jgi:hypothetical protein
MSLREAEEAKEAEEAEVSSRYSKGQHRYSWEAV